MVPFVHPVLQVCIAGIALTAAFTDIRARIIPNWLVIAGVAAGFGLNTVFYGWQGLAASALGFGLALLIYVPLFILRAMGGGDVKLMAAIGCMVGPRNWFEIFIYASVAGGIYGLFLVMLRNSGGGVLWNMLHITRELVRLRLPFKSKPELDIGHAKALSVPHAVAIAAGAFLFLYVQRN
jgi:prepilin peptidase CpaA